LALVVVLVVVVKETILNGLLLELAAMEVELFTLLEVQLQLTELFNLMATMVELVFITTPLEVLVVVVVVPADLLKLSAMPLI
jgi:hypothetical protein